MGQPKVYHLANQAWTVSHTFIQRLITFIDSTYSNLCHVSRFQEKQSWVLTMTVVDRILVYSRSACAEYRVVMALRNQGKRVSFVRG